MKSYLTTMTVDEFVKHMKSETAALDASWDDDRSSALEESLKAYDALDKTDANARVPVRMVTIDESADELAKKLDDVVAALSKVSTKVDELAARLDKTEKTEEHKTAETKAEEQKAEDKSEKQADDVSSEKKTEETAESEKSADEQTEEKTEDKAGEEQELEKVTWESDMAPALSAEDAYKLGAAHVNTHA